MVGQGHEFPDQRFVVAFRLLPLLGQLGQDILDAVDGLQDRGDRDGLHRGAVAELPDHGFRSVGQRLETRQADEAAGPFDRVDQPEDVAQDVAVIGILLEAYEFPIDRVEILAGLRQELLQQLVHAGTSLNAIRCRN